MSEKPTKKKGVPKWKEAEVTLRGFAPTVEIKPVVITLEEKLRPILREMDLDRLYQLKEGADLVIEGAEDMPKERVKLLAGFWYEKREREQDSERTERGLNIMSWQAVGTVGSLVMALFALIVAILALIR